MYIHTTGLQITKFSMSFKNHFREPLAFLKEQSPYKEQIVFPLPLTVHTCLPLIKG